MYTRPVISPRADAPHESLPALLQRVFLRKLWLPRFVYEALPYLYVLLGLAALTSALYAPGWTWIIPYLVLVGLVCLHAGLALVTLRYRFRRRRRNGPA